MHVPRTLLMAVAVLLATAVPVRAQGTPPTSPPPTTPPPNSPPQATTPPTATPQATPPPATPVPNPQPTPTPPGQGAAGSTPAPTVASVPGLAVILVIDVSGSMGNNNKLADAKAAALETMGRYLNPGGEAAAAVAAAVTPVPRAPAGVSLTEVQRMDRFRDLVGKLDDLQRQAGSLLSWSKQDMQRMRSLINQMDDLMQGVVLEKKQALLKQLNPMVEKMHFAIAKKVNHRLGNGLRYMVSGKKSDHPDFGGLFANKMSDHDAIYVGARANEAKQLHVELAGELLDDDWLRRTDSAMESGALTFRAATNPGRRREDFRAFLTWAESNNDWMRTVSGGGWVSDYVVEKGEVIALDALKANPDEARRTLQETLPELRRMGVSFDSRGPGQLGYNLGAVSDFDRQYMLNLHRQQAAGEALHTASVLQKEKYFPRFEQMGKQALAPGEQFPQRFVQLKEQIKAAKAGGVTPEKAQQLEEAFSEFRDWVRQRSAGLQSSRYADLLSDAAVLGASDPKRQVLLDLASELADDTQGALTNYRQLEASVNPVLGRREATLAVQGVEDGVRAGGRAGQELTERVARDMANDAGAFLPSARAEWTLSEAVAMERVGAFGSQEAAEAGARATSAGGKTLIRSAQGYKDFIRNNPGTTLFYVAGLGWVGWEVYDALQRDDVEAAQTAAAMFAGQEAATWVAEYALATRLGYSAGAGGLVVATASVAGMVGYYAAKASIQAGDEQRSVEMMSGLDRSNRQVDPGRAQGFLDALGVPAPSDQELAGRYVPGRYGANDSIEVNPNTGAIIIRRRSSKLTGPRGFPVVVDDWDKNVRVIPRNELKSDNQLGRLFDHWRGQYRKAIDDPNSGVVEAGQFDASYTYDDGFNSFTVPNPGGALSRREYVFYRSQFDEAWKKYTSERQQMPWNAAELFRAKAEMFKKMMAAAVEGKQRDLKVQREMDFMTVEDLEVLRAAVEGGGEYYRDGRKLTTRYLDDRIALARSARDGELRAILDDFQTSSVNPEFQKEIDVLISMSELSRVATPGDVEFGLMAYSGSCDSKFWFHPFTTQFAPLSTAVRALSSGGGTPMTPALYQARYALWTETQAPRGAIILLTDGQNGCTDNPVEASERIYQRVVDSSARPGAGPGAPGASAFLDGVRAGARLAYGLVTARSAYGAPLASIGPVTNLIQDMQQAGFRRLDPNAPVPTARQQMPITVSTVGFNVSDAQQAVLDTMAAVGGGVSARADNLPQLAAAFQSAVQQASAAAVAPVGGGGAAGGMVVGGRRGMGGAALLLFALSILSALLVVALVAVQRGWVLTGAGGGGITMPRARPVSGRAPGVKIELSLEVTDQDGYQRRTTLLRAPAAVGRDADNDLVLDDPEVSRHHARVVVSDGQLVIEDLGSTGGLVVDGESVPRARLDIGTSVRLGRTTLRVV